jgi:PAS domain S-box-containing protein
MRLAALFRDMSIRRKLTLIAVLSAGVALLFVAFVSMFHQWFLLHSELEQTTHSQASIVATNSTSALVFNDPKSAGQTLEALGDFGNIEFAMLYGKQGKVFAMFIPAGQKPPPPCPLPEREQHIFTSTHLEVFHPIFFEGERVGTLHVRSSLGQIYRQMAWSAALMVAAALGGMGLALLLIAYTHPAITGPMIRLVGLMEAVSREKNYGLRAEFHGKDELGVLAQGLNDMLGKIQMRDDALAQHHQNLEGEVAQRTVELKEANLLLGKELAERKAAEQELQAANEQLSILLDLLPIAVYRCRAEGDFAVMYMSHNVVTFTGYESKNFIEKSDLWIKHIHPDDAPRVAAEMTILFEKGMHSYEYRWQNVDGTYRWILDSLRLIRPEDGTPSYMVGMWQDITERKHVEERICRLNEELEEMVQRRTQQLLAAQEELVRKEKLAVLGQVAGSVGHELRNPLAVMSNAVYFLQTVLTDADETTREYLGIIKDEIAGSERIVSDLLDSVRTKPPQPKAVGVREVIGQTLGKLTIPPSVSVKLDIPETLSALRVDVMQIQQVFRNLISNGMEAMPDGGVLEIRAVENRQGGTVTVSVRDSGRGITPEGLAKLFQPLFTTKASGIGLGLVVVKNLTQANGGTIMVQSEIGRGTTFTITLPTINSSIEVS